MLHGLPSKAGNVLTGLAGVVVLSTAANAVVLGAEAVRRAVSQGLTYAGVFENNDKAVFLKKLGLDSFFPYSKITDWSALSYAIVKNVAVAAGGLFLLNKFTPSVITNANNILNHLAPIQFTSQNFVPFKYFRH